MVAQLALAFQLFSTAADGQRYLSQSKAIQHVATKAVSSLAVYRLTRRPLLATVGVWAAGKTIELLKGHTLGPKDTIHDLGWHALLVLPASTGKPLIGVGIASGLLVTARWSSPRWL